jgi:hypothetical protein
VEFNAPNFRCKSNRDIAVAFSLESHAGALKANDMHPATPRLRSVPRTNFMGSEVGSII